MKKLNKFQSTHPAWGATIIGSCVFVMIAISIHAPRVGCDVSFLANPWCFFYFNPRTPRGVRQANPFIICNAEHISIHAPRVGCDLGKEPKTVPIDISIHAPRVGCD